MMADYGEGIRNYDRFTVRPRSGRLDDDRWHDVRIVRRGRQVTCLSSAGIPVEKLEM